jgi:hypothetical protein
MNAYAATDGIVIRSILVLVFIGSMYFAGRMAARRGRSFRNWALIAGTLIGPLAFPLLLLLPNLQHKDPQGPEGEQPPAGATRAIKPAVQGNPDPGRVDMSFVLR